MTSPSLDQYIDKLNEIPHETIPILHQIRTLDRQVLSLHIKIENQREQTLQRISQYDIKPTNKLKTQINDLLKQISQIQTTMLTISKQKMKLSDQIYNCIDTPTEQLNRDLTNRIKIQQPHEQTKTSKYKRPHKNNQQEFCASQPIYCYCRRPSFGLMVKCQNQLCEVQWFHRDCLEQKNLVDKWFCKECRKTRGKFYKNGA